LQNTATKNGNTGKRGGSSGKQAAASSPAPSVSNPVSKVKHNLSVSSCCNCGIVIAGDTKALQCDRCTSPDSWKCAECLNISSDMYEKLLADQNLALRWFCDSCEKAVMDTHCSNSVPQNDKLDNLISLIERLMHKYELFETKLVDKCDTADVVKLELRISQLEERLSKWDHVAEARLQSLEQKAHSLEVDIETAKTSGPTDEEMVKVMVQEEMNKKSEAERDTDIRKKNVIIYRVPEKKADNVSDRKANDEIFVKDLLDAVFNVKLDDGDLEKMYRLGHWTEGTARPLLIGFKDHQLKQQIMANVRKLQQQQIARFRGISMSHDLHPKEREEIKLMVRKAKEDHEGEGPDSVENYRFRVVGQGQKKRVIKIRKQPSASCA